METNNSDINSSFALVRTDVRLTGNIKLTVDTKGDIWLNTIDSNDELANASYKHSPIVDEWTYPANVNKLISGNDSIVNVFFDIKSDVDQTSAVTNLDYSKQYDFSLYFSGARYLQDVNYTEKFSYFAPFYFRGKDIPEYFVILRIDGPLNATLTNLIQNKEALYDTKKYMFDIINNSTIIKTVSLKTDTRIGRYIRKIVCSDDFPESPLSVNFNEGMETVFSGLNIKSGVYSSASELMYEDFYSKDMPLKVFEEYITNGFQRHGLLYPNIINFEFLFNDDSAEIFDHNRYIGFYLNEVEFSKLMVDYRGQKDYQDYFKNTPHFYNQIKRLPTSDLFINNEDGCKLAIGSVEDTDTSKSYDNILLREDNQVISVLKDKKGDFYRIKGLEGDGRNITSIQVTNKEINVKNFLGSDDVVAINDFAEIPENPGKTFIRIDFNELPKDGEKMIIYHIGGSHVNARGEKYDIINFFTGFGEEKIYGDVSEYYYDIVTYDNYELVYTPDLYYRANVTTQQEIIDNVFEEGDYVNVVKQIDGYNDENGIYHYDENGELVKEDIYTIEEGKVVAFIDGKRIVGIDSEQYCNSYYVGVEGNETNISKFTQGLADCINEMPQRQFTAYSYGRFFAIVYNASGSYDDRLSVSIDIDNEKSYSVYGEFDGYDRYNAIGGSDSPNVLLLDYRLTDNIDNTCVVRTKDGYSMVARTQKYAGYFHRNMTDEELGKAFTAISDYVAVILETTYDALLSSKKVAITHEYKIPMSYMSIYNIKDFDFSFYSKRYDVKNDFDANKNLIRPNEKLSQKYIYSCTERPTFEKEVKWIDDYLFYVIEDDNYITQGEAKKYAFVNSYGEVDYTISDVYKEEGTYLVGGINFNEEKEDYDILLVPDIDIDVDNIPTLNGDVDCEYDYNKENYYPTYETVSKTIPYICKWGYDCGNDLRGNPYRLNTSFAFGKYNMSPNTSKIDIDVNAMNLEWMYMFSNAISDENYCYLNRYFDVYNADFDKDLVYVNSGIAYYRYSIIKYNSASGCCETFFRGLKLQIRELSTDRLDFYSTDNVKYVEKSRKYDGYKFCAILEPVEEVDGNADNVYEMKVIENEEKKYIIFYVTVQIGSVSRIKLQKKNKEEKVINDANKEEIQKPNVRKNIFEHANFVGFVDSIDKLSSLSENQYVIFNDNYIRVNDDETRFKDKDGNKVETIYKGDSIYKKGDKFIVNKDVFYDLEKHLYEDKDICISGDYRFIFEDNLCNITYTDLYKITDKKFYEGEDDFSTIKIPTNLILNGMYLTGMQTFSYIDYDLSNEVFNFESENIICGVNRNKDKLFTHLCSKENKIPIDTKILEDSTINYVRLNNELGNISLVDLDRNFVSDIILQEVEQIFGGKEYYKHFFKNITTRTIFSFINNRDFTVSYMGNTKCALYIEPSTEIKKSSSVITTPIMDNSNTVIGYNYDTKEVNDSYIYRYSGKYIPLFNNVISMSNNSNTGYNTVFNSSLGKFATIENFGHMKVSDGDIYSFLNDKRYNLEYELVGETPIGKKDLNVLHTSWDLDFHMKYTDKNSYENVPGTLRIEEDNTMINNVIVLPDEVNLTKFKTELVNDVSVVDMKDKEIVYSIYDGKVSVRVNMNNVMISKLLKLGIEKAFDYLDVSSDDYYTYYGMPKMDYINEYITKNILNLYDINSIYVYYERVQSKQTVEISDEDFESKKISNFIVDRNVKINKEDNYVISFEYSVKQNYNSLINLVAVMKLI